MEKLFLRGEELRTLGIPQGRLIGLIIKAVKENYSTNQKDYVMNLLKVILKFPEEFSDHKVFGNVVNILTREEERPKNIGKRAPLREAACGRPEEDQ